MDGKEVVWVNAQSVISPAWFYLAFPLAFSLVYGEKLLSPDKTCGDIMRGEKESGKMALESASAAAAADAPILILTAKSL